MANKTSGNKVLNILVPNDFYNKLYSEAAKRHIAVAAFVRMACSEWLEANDKKELFENKKKDMKSIDEIFVELEKD